MWTGPACAVGGDGLPWLAKSLAAAAPMPFPAPVIRATCPSRRRGFLPLALAARPGLLGKSAQDCTATSVPSWRPRTYRDGFHERACVGLM